MLTHRKPENCSYQIKQFTLWNTAESSAISPFNHGSHDSIQVFNTAEHQTPV